MWPLTGSEVVKACQGKCSHPNLDSIHLTGTCTDSRRVQPQNLFVAIKGEKFDGHSFVANILDIPNTMALVSEHWFQSAPLTGEQKLRCITAPDVTHALRNLARMMRQRFSFPVIGIGGSNGKTTTKEMLSALLGGKFRVSKTAKSENGFLGLAMTLTNPAHAMNPAPHALVLEIGIDEKGAMSQHCQIGNPDWVLLTALGPEHLAKLENWETAVEEEYHLFDFSPRTRRVWQGAEPILKQRLSAVRAGDTIVLAKSDLDSSGLLKIPGNTDSDIRIRGISVLTFHCETDDGVESDVEISWYPTESLYSPQPSWRHTIRVPLPGAHNAANFALALATALSLGRTPREVLEGWKNFEPPAMRSLVSTLPNGCILYNDCYNASPESMKAAFHVMKRSAWNNKPKVLFLGDMLDLGSESRKWHLDLITSLQEIHDAHLCFFGNAMYDVVQELKKDPTLVATHHWKISHLSASEDPRLFLNEVQTPFSSAVVLVKGSRGMNLGRVVSLVEEKCR
jgi:UDP-N-acetylmuramoyl-tripeptide--D-alanyl-D-alanine ligase